MKITPDGQITIPAEIRERLGFVPETELEYEIYKDALHIRKKSQPSCGSNLIELMQGKATVKLTTDFLIHSLTNSDTVLP